MLNNKRIICAEIYRDYKKNKVNIKMKTVCVRCAHTDNNP